jgi:arylsulfatase A-like enzyme/predicted TIM-barrel fold metal-dependent hydrolase
MRQRLAVCLTLLLGSVFALPVRGEEPKLPVIVDTHVHLWDIERRDGLGWIAKDNRVLYRSFLPETFKPIAQENGVRAVVVMQAGQSLDDNQWNLEITASQKDLFRGVVGNLSKVIGTPEFVTLFEKLCKDERYVGYRLSGRYRKGLDDDLIAHLELTARRGRTVDFLVSDYTLDDVAEISRKVPKLKIILDHFGNVELNEKPLDPTWVKSLRGVAKQPNVYCKVSALYGRVKKQPAPQNLEFYRPILDLALEAFGEDRLVFGSDWPVTETTADYASVVKLMRSYFESKPKLAEKVFSGNALRFYGISLDAKPLTKKPNIVYLLADDLGYGDLGCYHSASKIATPNMDRLAKEGMRFTDAHSPSAVCTPTRYALLTGRYAWRTRLQRNVIGPFSPPLIDAKQLTVPQMLRDQGYTTACIGKWHLGWGWPKPGDDGKRDFNQRIPDGPTTRGFDFYFGTDVPNYPPYCFIENDRTVGIPSEAAPVGRDSFNIAGPMVPGWKLVEVLPGLEKRAVEYLDRAAKGDQPFFLYLPLTSPHYPVVPSADFKGKSKVGDYGDFVMQTDHLVGQILATLKRNGIEEKTLVILTSDNGPEITGEVNPGAYDRLRQFGHASMGPLRGAKRDAWEGGHRVPFLARWPGQIPPGTTSDETICHVDLMATLATLLNVKLPDDAGVDSVNILPALRGEKRPTPLREATVHHSGQGKFAIRQGDWVLIFAATGDDNRKQGEPAWFQTERGYSSHKEVGELYHLATDPTQKKNRYATEPEKVKELTGLMERYIAEGRSTPGPKQKNDVEITWKK